MKKINVVLMRGLLGEIYSRGMDTLGARLAKVDGVDYVTVEDYTNWRSIRNRISKWKDPTVIGGHSFGANAATVIAKALNPAIKIPLILSVDPSQFWSWSLLQFGPSRIGSNVDTALNMYQSIDIVGRQKLSGSGVINIPITSSHTQIDDLPLVHDQAVAAVKKVIG